MKENVELFGGPQDGTRLRVSPHYLQPGAHLCVPLHSHRGTADTLPIDIYRCIAIRPDGVAVFQHDRRAQ